MGNGFNSMTLRVKLFRCGKTVLSLAGVVTLAFTCAWLMVASRPATNEELSEKDILVVLSRQRSKLEKTENVQQKARGTPNKLSLLEESVDDQEDNDKDNGKHPRPGHGPETNRKSEHREPKSLQHPSFLKILKIAADDFNLTCSHVVPDQPHRDFVEESKNPCFWDNQARKLQCLPYFYIPGFPKCGTTDFYNVIKYHPEFEKTGKEHHWFNHLQFMKEYSDIEVYLHKFEKVGARILQDVKDKGVSRKITGDFTPDYLCDSMRWRCLEGNQGLHTPRYTNAHSIHRLTPDAKFIIFMREPVERLYSRFKHMIHVSPSIFRKYWGDPTPETFHQAAMRAITIYRHCMQSYPARHCLYNETLYEQAMINDLGLYPVCLEDYLEVFPRENFLFLQFEQYTKSRKEIFQKVLKFLDMAPFPQHLRGKLNSTKVHNAGHFGSTPMLGETRVALRHFFAPFVANLKEIVGEDLIESWGY